MRGFLEVVTFDLNHLRWSIMGDVKHPVHLKVKLIIFWEGKEF